MEPRHERIARIAALESAGYKATVIMSADTFRRLILTDPADGSEEKIELSADWRAHEPVQLDVGPVLHADDAVANKVCALFGRALLPGRTRSPGTRDSATHAPPRSPSRPADRPPGGPPSGPTIHSSASRA